MVSKKNSGSGSGSGAVATGGGGLSFEARKQRLCFKNRKACILKKTMEVSVLCDVDACAIVFNPDGEVETWPENHDAVPKTIRKYEEWLRNNKKMVSCDDDMKTLIPFDDQELGWDDALADGLSSGNAMNDFVAVKDFWKECMDDQNEKQGPNCYSLQDFLLDSTPVESLEEISEMVDSKLQAVTERLGLHQPINNNGKTDQQNIQTSSFQPEALEDSNSHSETLAGFIEIQSTDLPWSEIGSRFSENGRTECFEDGLNFWFNGDQIWCVAEASEGVETPLSLESEGFGDFWGGLMA